MTRFQAIERRVKILDEPIDVATVSATLGPLPGFDAS